MSENLNNARVPSSSQLSEEQQAAAAYIALLVQEMRKWVNDPNNAETCAHGPLVLVKRVTFANTQSPLFKERKKHEAAVQAEIANTQSEVNRIYREREAKQGHAH